MFSMRFIVSVLTATSTLLASAESAQARTIGAAAGRAMKGVQETAFQWTNTGMAAPSADPSRPHFLIIPVVLDDASSTKTFIARGIATHELTRCVVQERGTRSRSTFLPITAPGAPVAGIPVVVLPGNAVEIVCTFVKPEDRVILIEHTP